MPIGRKTILAVDPKKIMPPDPILALDARYKADTRREKMNAGVGVFCGEDGKIFMPQVVADSWKNLDLGPKGYFGPTGEEMYLGHRDFIIGTANFVFGKFAKELLEERKLAAIGTPGGTGAVSIMAAAIRHMRPGTPMVIGIPTWSNHLGIAEDNELPVIKYNHMKDNKYNIEANLDAIRKSPQDSVVVFHTGKTHNPTGVNPSTEKEWRELAQATQGRIAFFDAPYAGFEGGLILDTEAIRIFMEEGIQVAVAVSYSKNAGIYDLRCGALLIPCSNEKQAKYIQGIVNGKARTQFSNPPSTGELIMAPILKSQELFNQFDSQLGVSRENLRKRRAVIAETASGLSFVTDQFGLFSMLPLNPEQVEDMYAKYAITMSVSGRANIGGVTVSQAKRLAEAFKEVV